MSAARRASGFTVAETLVALLLLGAVLHLCWAIAAAQERALRAIGGRGEVIGASRAVWWVLGVETSAGRAGRDWAVSEPDVLALRAFRGRGLGCAAAPDAAGWIDVRYRGWRSPDPAKDSVLTLDASGGWTARDLADRDADAGACAGGEGERAERWRLDPPPGTDVLVARVFERGSYHLEDRAFRYRRGAAGRQPLTPEVVDPAGSGIAGAPGGGAVVRFRGIPGSPGANAAWTRTLGGG